MKKHLLSAAIVMLLAAPFLHAQQLAGDWQGTMHNSGRSWRVVLKIQSENSKWSAVLYSIDETGPWQHQVANDVTARGAEIQCLFTAFDTAIRARLSSDGRTLAGSSTLGGVTTPLVLERATPETAWAIPEPEPLIPGMDPAYSPTYILSTIKPSDPASQVKPGHSTGRILTWRKQSLVDMINFAYGLQTRQIVIAAGWAEKDLWDVDAKMDGEGVPDDQQIKRAFQKLIEERFKLAYHFGPKAMDHYEIVLTSDGPKNLTKSNGWNGNPHDEHHTLGGGRPGVILAKNCTLQDLGNILGRFHLDKPVVNKTGLNARYDFSLYWTPDEFEMGGAVADVPPAPGQTEPPPGLFLAVQQQLGIELVPSKEPMEVMIVDRAEKPTEN